MIASKVGGPLPFKMIDWKLPVSKAVMLPSVTLVDDVLTNPEGQYLFCSGYKFTGSCFSTFKSNEYDFGFSLLKSTEGLEDGSN